MRTESLTHAAGLLATIGVVLGSGALAQAQQRDERRDEGRDERRDDRRDDDFFEKRVASPDEKVVDRFYYELKDDGPGVRRDMRPFFQRIGDAPGGGADKKDAPRGALALIGGDQGYYVGLNCNPADAALRAQLGLGEGVGLVVDQVVPDSPAAKAGFQRYDVLTKAGDKTLTDVKQLSDAVQSAKDREIVIALVRGGRPETIKVAPAKRTGNLTVRGTLVEKPDRDAIIRWFEHPIPEMKEFPLRLHLAHPGMVVGDGKLPPLPKNLSISISKSGDEPAKIAVRRGDGEKWDVTDKELDKLPDDIRPHVKAMLGGGPTFDVFRAAPGLRPGGEVQKQKGDFLLKLDPSDERSDRTIRDRIEERVDRRIDELNRRLDQLRESIDELRKGRGVEGERGRIRDQIKDAPRRDDARRDGEKRDVEKRNADRKDADHGDGDRRDGAKELPIKGGIELELELRPQ